MKNMNYLYMSVILCFFSCSTLQKNEVNTFDTIKEIWVYEYFSQNGYTTAGAYSEFMNIAKNNTPKFKLGQNEVDSLCSILSEVKAKKIFQTKMGGGVIFAEIITEDNMKLRTIICPNLMSVDAKKDYWIRDEKNQKRLDDFRNRIIEMHFKE